MNSQQRVTKFALIFTLFLVLPFVNSVQGQSDSIEKRSEPIKEITVDFGNKESVNQALKKLHTYKHLQSVVLEGETDEVTLNKILTRLSTLTNLSSITFKENGLKKPPINLMGLKAITKVTIEGNSELNYNELYNVLGKLQVTELNLVDNDLPKNPGQIEFISTLKKLKITGSTQLNYEDLVDHLQKIPNLNELAIPVNFITEIPRNITKLSGLQILDVSSNALTELPKAASSFKALNNLSIQGNLILNPAEELEKLKGADIRSLSLDKEISGDEIDKIKKTFPNAEINFPLETKNEMEENDSNLFEHKNLIKPVQQKGRLKAKQETKILSAAYLFYGQIFRNINYQFDTLTFEERYSNFSYCNVYKAQGPDKYVGGILRLEKNRFGTTGKRTETWFRFKMGDETFGAFYPELKAFLPMYWVYQGELSKKQFKRKIIKKNWKDVRINLDDNNSLFTIELKGDTSFIKFKAYPLISSALPAEKSQKTYSRRYSYYQKMLLQRASRFRKDNKREKRKYDSDFKKLKEYAWVSLQSRMSDEEKLMSKEDWLDYYDAIIFDEKKALDKSSLLPSFLERALTVRGFRSAIGTFIPKNTISLKSVNVDFLNENGAGALAVNRIYIIDKQNKTCVQNNGTLGIGPNRVVLKQFSNYVLIVELRNGNFGVVGAKEIDSKELFSNNLQYFRVKLFDKNLDTLGDCLKEAGIE